MSEVVGAKVSILMPVYNEEKFLSKAIDSIIAQDFTDWELIIINDGSSDGTEDVIKRYKDARVKYIPCRENRGRAYALNLGLSNINGEYVLTFDGDDIAYPSMISSQNNYLDSHPEYIAVCGKMDYIDKDGNLIATSQGGEYKTDVEIRAFELFGNCISSAATMFRRRVLEEHNLHFKAEAIVSQDYIFWLDMLPYGEFARIEEVVYKYRTGHGSAATRIVKRNTEWYDKFMREIFAYAWEKRGFDLCKNETDFIHDFLYKSKLPIKMQDIIVGLCAYKHVCKQLEKLDLKEGKLIKSYFIKRWKFCIKRTVYLMLVKIKNIFQF